MPPAGEELAAELQALLGGGDWDADPELATAKLELARNNVYLYYFYQSLSWGIFVELYTYLATDTICGGDTACGTALGTYNSMLYGLCQFLSNPVMGTISDRIGRRPVIAASLAGGTGASAGAG